ncbi:MAG: enoyl-CoA hydratase [Candidatus Thermofonsia Clade 1 bacterium]|uniref:Enoyl-CoA hydratase n=1 Tax=Candidatus Thermofonsia Clade 1 bacterium TaxID=2364210 RepID=A0A2M8NZY9_9CHLR|nr:MAG: enoyl-CoA hydratase [Candidatus Thermofonsia Clade 1 bacterium]
MPKVEVGARASRTKTITDADIRAFAAASGDTNSIHLDEEYAKTTRFGRRIAHGMLTASLISAVLGNDLPGTGTIYLSQTLHFKAPVYLDDTITATVEVTAFREDKRITTLRTVCTNQEGTVVLEGEATVIAPKEAS